MKKEKFIYNDLLFKRKTTPVIFRKPEQEPNSREDFLNLFYSDFILPLSERQNLNLEKKPLLSFGIPSSRKAIGECWSNHQVEDDIKSHIFISPGLTDPVTIFGILIHEAIHTQVKGHGKMFAGFSLLLGLEGDPRCNVPNKETRELINEFCTFHNITELNFALNFVKTKKKQTTRLIKLECPTCGYIVRTSRACIEIGLPICPCGDTFQDPDAPIEEEDPEEE